jgi:hypothetical protein
LSAGATGGFRVTSVEGGTTGLGYLFDANMTYKTKHGDVSAFAFESAAPSSLGGVQNTLSFGLRAGHNINRSTRAGLAVVYGNFTSPSGERRQDFLVAPIVTHDLSRQRQISAAYSFDQENGEDGLKTTNTLLLRYAKELTKSSRAELSYTFTHQHDAAGIETSNAILFRYSHDIEILH